MKYDEVLTMKKNREVAQEKEYKSNDIPMIDNNEQKKKKHKKDKHKGDYLIEMENKPECMESENVHINVKKKKKKDNTEIKVEDFSKGVNEDYLSVCNPSGINTNNKIEEQKNTRSDDIGFVESDEQIRKKKKHKKNENGYRPSDVSKENDTEGINTASAGTGSPVNLKKQKKKKRNASGDGTELNESFNSKAKRKKNAGDVSDDVNDIDLETKAGKGCSSQFKSIDRSCVASQKEKSLSDSPIKGKKKGRPYTFSIAIPISVVMETLLLEKLRTYVIGQLARAACIYSVDEIIVYDDKCWKQPSRVNEESIENDLGMIKMILEYQECPQYLRPCFFPRHRFLQEAGVLNPLNAPHHLRANDIGIYREGIVVDKSKGNRSYANVGLESYVLLDQKLDPDLRVTVKIPPGTEFLKKTFAYVVSPEEPRISEGLYWGYTVRVAKSLSEVFKSDRFEGDYDLIIGTSDKGDDSREAKFPQFSHALIVFGGMEGLEAAIAADNSMTEKNITKPKDVFPYYLNVCPEQSSRTIRTEEAVLIVLSTLAPDLAAKGLRT